MRIVVIGGSAAGLSTGLLLARAGHTVTVLDQEPLVPAPDIETAASAAFRVSAPQVVQPHALLSGGRQLLAQRWPDVHDGLLTAGAVESTLADQLPPTLVDRSPRPGDDELAMLLTRRSTFDWVLLRAAAEQTGLTLSGGTRVTGLLAEPGARPQVRGVVTSLGKVEADAVVDASGRRSPVHGWLTALGAAPPRLETAECGLAYYSRHYRRRPGAALPGPAATRIINGFAEFTAGLWGSDNDTMLFALAPLAADRRFRASAHRDVFEAVLRTVPVFAAWLTVLEPITDVFAMGGLHNTLRRLVVDGAPVATGLYAVGDSVCTTNPTHGRGLTLTLQGAADLVDVLSECDDPHGAALELDSRIGRFVEPFYRDQARNDSGRLAELRHVVLGEAPTAPPSGGAALDLGRLRAAATVDPVALRRFFRLFGLLDLPESVFNDRELASHVDKVLADCAPRPPAQPSAEQLVAALNRALVTATS